MSGLQTSYDPLGLEELAENLQLREESGQLLSEKQSDQIVSSSSNGTLDGFPEYLPLSLGSTHLSESHFSVEDFLLTRPYTSLFDLRTELRDRLATLKEELVKLINDDYEAFISLSTDLKDEGENVRRIYEPLQAVKEKIQIPSYDLGLIKNSISGKLAQRVALRKEKTLLNLLLEISDSLTRIESLLNDSLQSQEIYRTVGMKDAYLYSSFSTVTFNSTRNASNASKALHLYRVATEYSQLVYHICKAEDEGCIFITELQPRITSVREKLLADLDQAFKIDLSMLKTGSLENDVSYRLNKEGINALSDVTSHLRTYDTLNLWEEAEKVIRSEFVGSSVRKIISSKSLFDLHSPVLPPTTSPYSPYSNNSTHHPSQYSAAVDSVFKMVADPQLPFLDETNNQLAVLYNQILKFVQNDAKGLMDAAARVGAMRKVGISGAYHESDILKINYDDGKTDARSFDIMASVIWPEIVTAIVEELGETIFAAGKPDDLCKNYDTTQSFIFRLEKLAASDTTVRRMRSHPISDSLRSRWQLPVYFQLRRKGIIANLEEAFNEIKEHSGHTKDFANDEKVAVKASSAVTNAIRSCWLPGVYIPELTDKFWQTTLQILSSYRAWLDTFISDHGVMSAQGTLSFSTNSNAILTSTHEDLQKSDGTSSVVDDIIMKRFHIAAREVSATEFKILDVWKGVISVSLANVLDEGRLRGVEDVLRRSISKLSDPILSASSRIVNILGRRCADALAPVKLIPGQLRALSNKAIPKAPNPFVLKVLSPLKQFLDSKHRDSGAGNLYSKISSGVFDVIAERYIAYLIAMNKTEESLRRLKKGKKSGFSLFGTGTARDDENRDEERIRAQIKEDVDALGRDAESIGISIHEHPEYEKLRSISYSGFNVDVGENNQR